jgi:lysyl-tRNA synthetase class 2
MVLSPLAKPIAGSPHLTQRFELFINGWEVVNSYTELNDPKIQKQNTPSDDDFVEALEYGLAPCAGWGMGIDRFVMLLTNK